MCWVHVNWRISRTSITDEASINITFYAALLCLMHKANERNNRVRCYRTNYIQLVWHIWTIHIFMFPRTRKIQDIHITHRHPDDVNANVVVAVLFQLLHKRRNNHHSPFIPAGTAWWHGTSCVGTWHMCIQTAHILAAHSKHTLARDWIYCTRLIENTYHCENARIDETRIDAEMNTDTSLRLVSEILHRWMLRVLSAIRVHVVVFLLARITKRTYINITGLLFLCVYFTPCFTPVNCSI